jgi:ubiquinone/menaquinone biosynthesis C-methylase UbiE
MSQSGVTVPRAPRPDWLASVGTEALDSPACDALVTRATLADIAQANTLFGGRSAVVHGVARLLEGVTPSRPLTVLDVGAGMGDVAAYLEGRWSGAGTGLRAVTLDWHAEAARLCRKRGLLALQGEAQRLPVADGAVDIVVASQLLHHFRREAAVGLVRELQRVARLGVVIADLRRTWMAAWGIWLVSWPLRFHPASRHDGVVSVRRGYERWELEELLREAGVAAAVTRRPGFRLVATWRVSDAHR